MVIGYFVLHHTVCSGHRTGLRTRNREMSLALFHSKQTQYVNKTL